MQKSHIFNKHYPAPTDKMIYPIYKRFVNLQRQILNIWKDDVVSQRIGIREYSDLKHCRLKLISVGEDRVVPVISLKPMIGIDTADELRFYIRFFTCYNRYMSDILTAINFFDFNKKFITPLQEPIERLVINKSIMTLKIMICLVNMEKLTESHIDLLEWGHEDMRIEALDSLARESGLGAGLSDKFNAGGHFFEDPDEDLIQSFWEYSRMLNTRRIKHVSLGSQNLHDLESSSTTTLFTA